MSFAPTDHERNERPWYDYAFGSWPYPFCAIPTCVNCKREWTAGHVCPALGDLSPMGGGPKPEAPR